MCIAMPMIEVTISIMARIAVSFVSKREKQYRRTNEQRKRGRFVQALQSRGLNCSFSRPGWPTPIFGLGSCKQSLETSNLFNRGNRTVVFAFEYRRSLSPSRSPWPATPNRSRRVSTVSPRGYNSCPGIRFETHPPVRRLFRDVEAP